MGACVYDIFIKDLREYIRDSEIKTYTQTNHRFDMWYYTPYILPKREMIDMNKDLGIRGLNLKGNKNNKNNGKKYKKVSE